MPPKKKKNAAAKKASAAATPTVEASEQQTEGNLHDALVDMMDKTGMADESQQPTVDPTPAETPAVEAANPLESAPPVGGDADAADTGVNAEAGGAKKKKKKKKAGVAAGGEEDDGGKEVYADAAPGPEQGTEQQETNVEISKEDAEAAARRAQEELLASLEGEGEGNKATATASKKKKKGKTNKEPQSQAVSTPLSPTDDNPPNLERDEPVVVEEPKEEDEEEAAAEDDNEWFAAAVSKKKGTNLKAVPNAKSNKKSKAAKPNLLSMDTNELTGEPFGTGLGEAVHLDPKSVHEDQRPVSPARSKRGSPRLSPIVTSAHIEKSPAKSPGGLPSFSFGASQFGGFGNNAPSSGFGAFGNSAGSHDAGYTFGGSQPSSATAAAGTNFGFGSGGFTFGQSPTAHDSSAFSFGNNNAAPESN
ncbi:hypothetical protein FRC16_003871, partial [Serendipita sp. 398]